MPKTRRNKRSRKHQRHRDAKYPSQILRYFMLGLVLGMLVLFAYYQVGAGSTSPAEEARFVEADWRVGELRPDGLRIVPSGRADASQVLNPRQFVRPEVRRAYAIAHEIPDVLNQLYCWCGCENRGVHRSNLGCFEDEMSVNCAVCRGTAEIAYEMTRQGITDAGRIQAAVDEKWAPAN